MKLLNKIFSNYSNWRNNKFDSSPIYNWDKKDNIEDIYFRLKCDNFVISVGNLSLGGTGKTPLIETLIKEYLSVNASKCIIERGYKRKINKNLILSSENFEKLQFDEIGDEPLMLFEKTRVPISISENKFKAFQIAIEKLNPEIILIDDGFQHRWIERDLDILILDKNTINNPNFPPKGRLREPLSSIERADIIFVPQNYTAKLVETINSNQIILEFEMIEGNPYSGFNSKTIVKSEKFIAVSGIANPKRFHNSLQKIQIDFVEELTYNDHHNYSIKDIEKIILSAKKSISSVITTEKDFVKFKYFKEEFIKTKVDIFILPINFKIYDDNNLLNKLIQEKYQNKIKDKK